MSIRRLDVLTDRLGDPTGSGLVGSGALGGATTRPGVAPPPSVVLLNLPSFQPASPRLRSGADDATRTGSGAGVVLLTGWDVRDGSVLVDLSDTTLPGVDFCEDPFDPALELPLLSLSLFEFFPT